MLRKGEDAGLHMLHNAGKGGVWAQEDGDSYALVSSMPRAVNNATNASGAKSSLYLYVRSEGSGLVRRNVQLRYYG